MNWEAIGATGEVLGAIAVVFSLLYFAFQIRQNNKLLRENRRDHTQDQMTALRSMVLDRNLAELIWNGLSGDIELDRIDALRLGTWLNQFVWTHYQVWDRYTQDPSDSTWTLAAGPRLAEILHSPGAIAWWKEHRNEWKSEFVADIEGMWKDTQQSDA